MESDIQDSEFNEVIAFRPGLAGSGAVKARTEGQTGASRVITSRVSCRGDTSHQYMKVQSYGKIKN